MKKCLEEMQTLCAGCSKAEPKTFALPQTLFPEAWDSQNLISWRWSLPLPTNPVWWGSMHAISSYRGNRPTHTPTHINTQTGVITIHCAAASAQCSEHPIDLSFSRHWILPSSTLVGWCMLQPSATKKNNRVYFVTCNDTLDILWQIRAVKFITKQERVLALLLTWNRLQPVSIYILVLWPFWPTRVSEGIVIRECQCWWS